MQAGQFNTWTLLLLSHVVVILVEDEEDDIWLAAYASPKPLHIIQH